MGVLVPWIEIDDSSFVSHPISVSFKSMIHSLGQSVVHSHCKKHVYVVWVARTKTRGRGLEISTKAMHFWK
jgi:hypothetical protein